MRTPILGVAAVCCFAVPAATAVPVELIFSGTVDSLTPDSTLSFDTFSATVEFETDDFIITDLPVPGLGNLSSFLSFDFDLSLQLGDLVLDDLDDFSPIDAPLLLISFQELPDGTIDLDFSAGGLRNPTDELPFLRNTQFDSFNMILSPANAAGVTPGEFPLDPAVYDVAGLTAPQVGGLFFEQQGTIVDGVPVVEGADIAGFTGTLTSIEIRVVPSPGAAVTLCGVAALGLARRRR